MPPFPYTITATEMRTINLSAVLEIIRRESPISRSEIAEKLDVSLPTVMRIVDELIKEDLVRTQAVTEWSGGRRRSLLEFNASSQVVIGVDLGGTKMYGAVTDLGGTILDEVSLVRHGTSGDESYLRLVELIERLSHSPYIEGRKIRGIGVGAPGITHQQEGVVSWAPSLNWQDYPLRSKLFDHFKMPVAVENDVNLAALGELWFGAGENTPNMVLITIGTGIGAGIIIDGALYRGANEAAGEIGYLLPGREFLGKSYTGFGAFESQASGTGIAERARKVLAGKVSASELENLSAEDVFDAMRRGEEWTEAIISDTVDYLAIAIAGITVLLDPDVIVLGGGVANSADLLIERILKRIEGTIPIQPKLAVSSLGRRAAVMGAITKVLHHTADFYVVRKLS